MITSLPNPEAVRHGTASESPLAQGISAVSTLTAVHSAELLPLRRFHISSFYSPLNIEDDIHEESLVMETI